VGNQGQHHSFYFKAMVDQPKKQHTQKLSFHSKTAIGKEQVIQQVEHLAGIHSNAIVPTGYIFYVEAKQQE
jgi:hypothetical protein